ncbi:MAG: hypothetical protein U1E17_01185 [Geminicoccaceae bacterium]
MPRIPVFAINTQMAARWWLRPFQDVANLYPLDLTNWRSRSWCARSRAASLA